MSRLGKDLHPGDKMPTEDELIRQFGVSRITVRRAVQNLVGRGLAVSKPGRGTFVTPVPKIIQPLTELTSFVEDVEAHGHTASARVLTIEEIPAPPDVLAALGLPIGSTVTFIERVRLADGRPISFDRTYLVPELGALIACDDLEHEPIFALLEQRHDTPLVEAAYTLQAVGAASDVAVALQLPPNSPILRIERTVFTTGNRPVDYEVLHYSGDTMAFTARLPRNPAPRGGDASDH